MLSKLSINSDNASVSSSENGSGPAYVSSHGSVDEPFSGIKKHAMVKVAKIFRESYYLYLHDGSWNFDLGRFQCKVDSSNLENDFSSINGPEFEKKVRNVINISLKQYLFQKESIVIS